MKIYEALPDVHFRFTEKSRIIRCCGRCGIELAAGIPDPCPESEACGGREREILESPEEREIVPVPCGAE